MSARKSDPPADDSQAVAADERQRELPAIPAGIEAVLGMAALNPDFAVALRRDRVAAVEATGVELTATERRIIAAVDDGALAAMIGNVGDSVPNRDRRAFLSRSAAALLVLAGGGGLASGCGRDGDKPKSKPEPSPAPPPPADAAPMPADSAPAPADAASAVDDGGLGALGTFSGSGGGSGAGPRTGLGKYPAITGITPKRPRKPRRPKERVTRGVSLDLPDDKK